ncbi:uncharacterized protein CLUP02_03156 [Colletotrichum lupini]|uniref:Uncharacterized protein n=1 Tax=Colletotrichum lupini TaxID=145971 RepID=A0A9Q8SIA6_9PEZI|nr:uncharacterized protein CLUP02_03156 [Colletotrichum lupini]UQC77685.1 hypothetical protein CLUP02_03156 [Colletotrichum lupini]
MVHSHESLATVRVYLTAFDNRDNVRNVLIPRTSKLAVDRQSRRLEPCGFRVKYDGLLDIRPSALTPSTPSSAHEQRESATDKTIRVVACSGMHSMHRSASSVTGGLSHFTAARS